MAQGNTDDMASEVFTAIRLAAKYHGDEAVKAWFNNFFVGFQQWNDTVFAEKASMLMSIFSKTGLHPDYNTPSVWTKELTLRYRQFNNIDEGQSCKVLSQAWLLNGTVIERGMVQGL